MTEASRAARVDAFRALHVPGSPLMMPNPWDVGAARILSGLGFRALATTSSGFALTLGRLDYRVTREELLAHCRALCAAVEVPVSADLEDGFGSEPARVAETVRLAAETGLAGGSIEDSLREPGKTLYETQLAVERVHAAVEAARAVPGGFVLTARCEAFLYGSSDLDALIRRLQAFEQVGADVLFAPGLSTLEQVRTVCAAVKRPVSVLLVPALRRRSFAELAAAGAARLSTGGAPAFFAYASLAAFARGSAAGGFDHVPTDDDDLAAIKGLLG